MGKSHATSCLIISTEKNLKVDTEAEGGEDRTFKTYEECSRPSAMVLH